MFLKSAVINHQADSLNEAMNLSQNQLYRCREKIIFSTIANALQGMELYEDREDCPSEFKTVTGDLSRTLSLITNPLEYEFTLLTFMKLQDLTSDVIGKYIALNRPDVPKAIKSKLNFLMSVADLFIEHKLASSDDEDDSDDGKKSDTDNHNHAITPGMLFKRIDLVKSSQYSWDTYYNMIKSKNFYYGKNVSSGSGGGDFDIDNMLNNLFNTDGE